MSGTYKESFEQHIVRTLTIEVNDAPSEEEGERIAAMYDGFDAGRYQHDDMLVVVEYEDEFDDVESNDDGDWQPDEDDEEGEW